MKTASPKYVVLLLVTFALAAAGCGSSSSSSSSTSSSAAAASSSSSQTTSTSTTPNVGKLPTVKFALHAGLAFGAFHRYIYKPFKAGSFTGGNLSKHKLAVAKAALAGLFAYHELKLAIKDAQASPTLSKLVAPVNALADKLKSIGSSVKSGKPDVSAIESSNGDITSLSGLASAAGISVPDQIPSAAQLVTGGNS
jgi:hypothetical protein